MNFARKIWICTILEPDPETDVSEEDHPIKIFPLCRGEIMDLLKVDLIVRKIWIGVILLLGSVLAGMLFSIAHADETVVSHAVTSEVLAQAKQQLEQAPPSLKEQATQVLQGLINAAVQTGEFIKEQVPLVVKELLAFNMVEDIVWCISGLVLIAAGVYAFRCFWKLADTEDCIGAAIFFGGGSIIAGIVVLFINGLDLLKITLAPRVWLLEYAANLVK